MTVCRPLPVLALAFACELAGAGSLEIAASVDSAIIEETESPGRHRTLPDLTVRLSLSAVCPDGTGLLSVNVADTRRSYPLETSPADALSIELVVPAGQLPPVPVPQDFCVAAADDADEATVRAGISVHTSLRCTAGDSESFSSRSAAADIPLSCLRRDSTLEDRDQDPEEGSSAARNSSARNQVSEASSGS